MLSSPSLHLRPRTVFFISICVALVAVGSLWLLSERARAAVVSHASPSVASVPANSVLTPAGSTITVNSTTDVTNSSDGLCTLREAITAANTDVASGVTAGECVAGSGDDTIDFSVAGTITLLSALPDLSTSMSINGPGANVLTVMRSSAGGTPQFRIFTINSGATVNMSGLSVSNGHPADGLSGSDGGGILNSGTLTITSSALSGNQAGNGVNGSSNGRAGGGIFNSGTLTLTNSTAVGNQSGSGVGGGFAGAGGGILNIGFLIVTNCTISGNQTGSANTGNGSGGGIYNAGAMTMTNSTISSNQTGTGGGFGGAGGGIYGVNLGPTTIGNSLIANNTVGAGGGGPDLFGTFNSRDYNLVGSTSNTTFTGTTAHNITNVNALLGPLANNGGGTLTHALLPNSPAIDAGDNCVTQATHCGDANIPQLTTDQRGAGFIRADDGNGDSNPTVDIGAYEVQSILVTNTTDSGAGSLRQAITDANANPDTSAINFQTGLTGTITLLSSLPSLTTSMSINGPGANLLTISGNNNRQIFFIPSISTVTISDLTISNGRALGLSGSSNGGPGRGGGIYNQSGILTVRNVTLTNNSATGGDGFVHGGVGSGGAICNEATMTIANCTITLNSAVGGNSANDIALSANGGGIFNSGTMSIADSTITQNSATGGTGPGTLSQSAGGGNVNGGGIANQSGTLTITNSTISDNTANGGVRSGFGAGGGIQNFGTLNINKSVVSGNSVTGGVGQVNEGGVCVGGGIENGRTLTITDTTISGNAATGGNGSLGGGSGQGGGIYNNGDLMTITNSVISHNSATGGNDTGNGHNGGFGLGGGLDSDQNTAITVTNSTLSGNSATGGNGNNALAGPGMGGGILLGGIVTLTNLTISGNSASDGSGNAENQGNRGGGVYAFSGYTINVRNTILAGNTAPVTGADVFGPFNSLGFNLVGKSDGGTGFTNGNNGDQVGTVSAPLNPLLAPLSNNGGSTQTQALLPGSSAINAGENCVTQVAHCGDANISQLTTDQRGLGFNRLVNTNVDIGAFESRGFTMTATGGTPQSATITTAFGSPLVATVSSAFGEPVAGGVVTFTAPASGVSGSFPGSVIATLVATNGSGIATSQTFIANGTAGGPYNVVASGNGISSSAQFSLTNTQAATSTSVTSSANPADFGQSVTFTATVTSSIGTPTGSIQFKDGAANLGTLQTLNGSGVATFSTSSMPAGSHTITADYSGTANFVASSGALASAQVVRDQPSLSINDVSVTEGDSGTKFLNFTVTLSAATSQIVTVNYATADGTAAGGSDYQAANGTLTLNPGDLTKPIAVTINGDQTFEPNESFVVNLSSPTIATISDTQGTGTILNDDAQGGIVSFSQANYSVGESDGRLTIAVNRSGDTSAAVTVDYATSDAGAPCSNPNHLASAKCDFTTTLGTLHFASGENSKTFTILINQDSFVEGTETFTISLSNLTGGAVFGTTATAPVTITDDATEPTTNAIDDASNFVRQNYHDFLNREPDASGLAFWTNEITSCGSDATCIERKRINVSAAFFLSIEFQGTGYLVERMYKTAYGDLNGVSTFGGTHQLPAPIVRFNEFLPDTQEIGQGVVVGQTGWEAALENNKQAFTAEFVQRSRFTTAYPLSMTPDQFVDQLNTRAGNVLSPAERTMAIGLFGVATNTLNQTARAQALRQVAEDADLKSAESNRAFVLMQYFGYLRRNPNDPQDTDYTGYDFWLTKLNQFSGNFVDAEMVKAFITSSEYRQRFGL